LADVARNQEIKNPRKVYKLRHHSAINNLRRVVHMAKKKTNKKTAKKTTKRTTKAVKKKKR
jgi:hypothetical protein